MAFCSNCGSKIEDGATFCSGCGRAVNSGYVQQQEYQPQPPPEYQQTPPPQEYQQPPQADPLYGAPWQQNQYYPPPADPNIPRRICSIFEFYGKVFDVLKVKPILLWGISMMFTLLSIIGIFLIPIPIIYLPVIATLQVGMISVFLTGYKKRQIGAVMLFNGFNDFKRVAGGMLWMWLWLFIWALIPLVGIVMVVIKSYAYFFVPYILLTQPEVSATGALKLSIDMTRGYKGKMFGAFFLIEVIVFVVILILYLLGLIPAVGIVFIVIDVIFVLLCVILLPLFMGLLGAAFFDEIERVNG